jgi:hypothetical protein
MPPTISSSQTLSGAPINQTLMDAIRAYLAETPQLVASGDREDSIICKTGTITPIKTFWAYIPPGVQTLKFYIESMADQYYNYSAIGLYLCSGGNGVPTDAVGANVQPGNTFYLWQYYSSGAWGAGSGWKQFAICGWASQYPSYQRSLFVRGYSLNILL